MLTNNTVQNKRVIIFRVTRNFGIKYLPFDNKHLSSQLVIATSKVISPQFWEVLSFLLERPWLGLVTCHFDS